MNEILEKQFEKQPDIVTRRVAGEVILVPVKKKIEKDNCLYTLDETATFLWERLDGRNTGRQLAQALESTYEITEGQAECDVRNFLEQLKEIEAVVTREAA